MKACKVLMGVLLWMHFPGGLYADGIVSILDFGAIGDGGTINTVFIQEAIDHQAKNGGGIVVVPRGNFVTGTLILQDDITLMLQEGAKIWGSQDPRDYKSIDTFVDATGQTRGKCLIGALGVENVAIVGEGTIDGRGENFQKTILENYMTDQGVDRVDFGKLMGNRPFLLRFVQSKHIQIEGVHLRQPAAWTCHFYQSSQIHVEDVTIYSHAHKNNDGIDLDSSHRVKIKNCKIDTGDDAICIKSTSLIPSHHIKVRDCWLKSDWGALKFGTESMGDFHHISVKNCTIADTKGGGIKILSVDGANIHHININSVKMINTEMPVFIRLGERSRTYRGAPPQSTGSVRKVSIKNIEAGIRSNDSLRIDPPTAIFITGTKDHLIESVKLKNIHISTPGGGKYSQRQLEIPTMPERYPEFSFFGVLPSFGLVAQHVESLKAKRLTFEVKGYEYREAVWLNNVIRPTIKTIKDED
ncbi:glycoside hydrolase family 28 protein [Echinicola rosea]|uniref:Exo-poly-alpha-D-galacturonosidase n=1 Tax=Echinicola rosea TaxID=1807691 RepID=A0ABQ1V406_9BACT|nr:glycosyl hydrolase family 28 protein [Echinicola rosea]GGF36358.1 exo-poly-alpha-D-galacturonosidase [Echinicola rosea]